MADDASLKKSNKSVYADALTKLGFARYFGTEAPHRPGERSIATRHQERHLTCVTDERGGHWIRYSAEGDIPEGFRQIDIP
jgi:hypothetical protein